MTAEELVAFSRTNGRICPQPNKWNELYQLLPDKQRSGNGWVPALPLILAAWWDTPALAKMLRLEEHINWANDHGALDRVEAFLLALEEKDWFHSGE